MADVLRLPPAHPDRDGENCKFHEEFLEVEMGRGILLWFLGVPIPLIILILLFWH